MGLFLKMEIIGSSIKKSVISKHSKGMSTMKGFTMIPNYILKNQEHSLNEIMVLVALKSFAMNNIECWPGLKAISTRTRLGTTTIKKTIKLLLAKDLIYKTKDNKRRSNVYTINY